MDSRLPGKTKVGRRCTATLTEAHACAKDSANVGLSDGEVALGTRPCLVVHLENGEERLLWDLDSTDALHAFLTFGLLL